MEIYLYKSVACLAILFLFYKLMLENTALHTTKRAYLIISIVASLVIPCITFTQYVEVAPITEIFTAPSAVTATTPDYLAMVNEPAPIDYMPYILWSIYGIGVLIFSIRFGRNLFSMVQKIKNNPRIKEKSIFYVLMQLPMTPHSFLNYIFFHKTAYETQTIPEEVIVHEQAHVAQKHSWDLLFIEVFRIVFWFNPLLYFVKNSIRLNHEFLADRAVLQSGANLSVYQNIILDFSSPDQHQDPGLINLAHSINYSSFKKRFTVMKTHTSKRAAWLKSMVLLPLLAVLIYGFSTTQVVEVSSKEKPDTFVIAEDIQIFVAEDQTIQVNGISATLETLPQTLKKFNTHLTEEQRKEWLVVNIQSSGAIPMGFIFDLKQILFDYGIKRINIPGKVATADHESYANSMTLSTSRGATPEQIERYTQLAKKYNAVPKEKRKIPLNELRELEKIYRFMTARQLKTVPPFPECNPKNTMASQQNYAQEYLTGASRNGKKAFVLQITLSEIKLNGIPVTLHSLASKLDAHTKDWEETDYTSAHPSILIASTPRAFLVKADTEFKKSYFAKANAGMSLLPDTTQTDQKKASAAQIAEYNELAKKYNNMPKNNMRINGKEFTRMHYLYDVMTVAQRRKAEPFPSIPPPPPSPAAPNPPKVLKGTKSNIPPPPPPPAPRVVTVYGKGGKKITERVAGTPTAVSPPAPPNAPTPTDPLDHMIEMAKKGANFYLEGKLISSDKAIDVVKKNKDLNIQITDSNTQREVKISKNPIRL